jgi:hypothetical protein
VADEIEPEEGRPGITRRTLIKRAAIIGGVAWATPVIMSTPAFAATAGSVIHACCACRGCGVANICNQDHTNSLPQLASSSACATFCSQQQGCAGSSYATSPIPFECTAGPGVGDATCLHPAA